MKRFSSAIAVAAAGSFLVSGVAFADNNTNHSGNFGIKGSVMDGAATDANGDARQMGALGFAYGISSAMVLTGNFGFGMSGNNSTTGGVETKNHSSDMGLGVEFDYKIVKGSDACTYLNVGFEYASSNDGVDVAGTDGGVKNSDMGFGLGLKGEWSPVKKLSFTTGVGLAFSPNGKNDQVGTAYPNDATGTEYSGMDIGIDADVLGNAAVTYWF